MSTSPDLQSYTSEVYYYKIAMFTSSTHQLGLLLVMPEENT